MPPPRKPSILLTLPFALWLSACDTEPRPERVFWDVPSGDARAAPAAFREYGCTSCHVIPRVRGARGITGPPLDAWSGRRFIAGTVRNSPEALVTFILDPQGVRPGSAMPDLDVPEADARNMAAYLYTLR